MEENQSRVTTDSWPWGKIIKHTLLPKPKGSPKAGKKEIALRIAFATVFGLIALFFFTGGKATLPSCDQQQTVSLVGKTVDKMPLVRLANVHFVSLKNITENGHNKDSETRVCSATLVSTAGEDNIQYVISWFDKKARDFNVEVQITD